MESNEPIHKTPKGLRRIEADIAETPLLRTPRPLASSTVGRKTFGSQYLDRDLFRDKCTENESGQYDSSPKNNENSGNMDDTSLGLLGNLSSFLSDDNGTGEKRSANFGSIIAERELARKLLQRCSDNQFPNAVQDTNKENNANSPNMSGDRTPSTLVDSAQSFDLSPSLSKEHGTLRTPGGKISNASVNFEPNEITARSSTMSKSMDNRPAQSPPQSTGGISFSSSNAELMAQFENEDFQSGSQMASQLLADEISWQQNASYALPIATSTEKEHLDFSCFSGIIGDFNLSIESCAGRKVSVGEFFKRKCGSVGELKDINETCNRPNFGFDIKSPKRSAKNTPLIDVTTMTEDSINCTENNGKVSSTFSETTKEHTLMSLSTIAQTLQDIDNGTPRRLVDQLLMAKKQKKKCPEKQPENLTSNTYTLPVPSRSSLPAISSSNTTKKFDNETSMLGRAAKLSLDSKTMSDLSGLNYQNTSRDSLASTDLGDIANSQADSSVAEIQSENIPTREMSTVNVTNSYLQDSGVKNFSTVSEALGHSSKNLSKNDTSSKHRESQTGIKTRRVTESPRKMNHSQIKKEEISAQRSALEASVSTNNTSSVQSSLNVNVRISKNTQELHKCIIGVGKEVDVEFENKSQRWIMCSLSLTHIQGDKENIELEVTPKIMLLPDASKTVKVGVKVLKPGKPVIAALNAEASQMPAGMSCRLQHVMCFVPEEQNIVSLQPTKDEAESDKKPGDNFRCETPQQQRGSVSSPTSPLSSAANRSGNLGRNSPLSSASGGTVAGDVISIRATHAALVWNSIKVGKNDTKEFTIRNTSNNKIKLQATIVDNDKSFKFLRDRQQVASHIVFGLQRMESRTFSVVFGPNNPGAAAGRIVFKHYEPKRESSESRPTKVIMLYGYGGIGKVEITEAFKDTGGQLWLSLGSLNAGGTLDAKIKLQNTGDLCSFAKVKLTPKAVYPAMVSSWHVDPTELLLGPKEVRWVTLEFRPRREDLALLKRANVSHVGTLTITHGDEPTRLRIRRLYKKLSQTGQMSGKETEAFRNVVYPICKVFPGETPINNLNTIRDSVENLGDLCRGVRQHEVMLTMEVNAEESMSMLHDNADDSQMFYSLCSDDSNVFPATEESFMPSETLMDCTIKERVHEDNFSVSPSLLTLKPPLVNEATVMIMSSSNVAQPFDTQLSHAEYLSVVPAEGMIPTRRGFPLRVQCKKRLDRNIEAVLQVFTENDKRDVHIRVLLH